MFSGVSSRCSSQPAEDTNTTVSRMPTAAHSSTDMVMALRSPFLSFEPKVCDTSTEKPCVMACTVHSTSQYSQSVAPSAASASTPTPRPTIDASATVYSC